jgi:hypothetical protein
MQADDRSFKVSLARDVFLDNVRREERFEMLKKRHEVKVPEPIAIEEEVKVMREGLEVYGDKALEIDAVVKAAEAAKINDSEMQIYANKLFHGDIIEKHEGIIKLRRCLCAQISTPIQEALDLGVLPVLIELVKQDQHPVLKVEAAWSVTNIASGDSQQVQQIVEKGVIPLFIQLLSKPDLALVEHAVWGLGNLAGDCVEFRDIVVTNFTMNSFAVLYERVKLSNERLRDQIIWAASNLCRRSPATDVAKIVVGLPMFAEALLTTNRKSTLIESVWSLAPMCNQSTAMKFVTLGLLPKLLKLLNSDDSMIQHPVSRIIVAISASGPELCEVWHSHSDSITAPYLGPHKTKPELNDQDVETQGSRVSGQSDCRTSKPRVESTNRRSPDGESLVASSEHQPGGSDH